jgi:hypothetical protein
MFENRVLRRIFGPKRDAATGDWRRLYMWSLMMCSTHQILLGDQIKKNEMGWACSMYGGEEICIQDFGGETEEGKPFGRPGLDWRILLKLIFKKWDGGMDWIGLAQNRDRWPAM